MEFEMHTEHTEYSTLHTMCDVQRLYAYIVRTKSKPVQQIQMWIFARNMFYHYFVFRIDDFDMEM